MEAALMSLFRYFHNMAIEANVEELTDVYRDALTELPDDLLEKSIKISIKTWKWKRPIPPAEMRENIKVELHHRQENARKINEMLHMAAKIKPTLDTILPHGIPDRGWLAVCEFEDYPDRIIINAPSEMIAGYVRQRARELADFFKKELWINERRTAPVKIKLDG